MKLTRELRARASLEKRSLTDAEKASGYIGALTGVIPFNSDSVTLTKRGRAKPFVEQIAPDAFKRSLKEDRDIMANAGHTDDPLAALGRIGENLTVTTSATELRWEALVPDTQAGKDLMSLVDKKIIRGTSFEFEVRGEAGEKWEKRDDRLDQRTILDARLIAFNPVTWPAYEDSSLTVELRRREWRDSYFGSDACYDPMVSDDVAYAIKSLGGEVCELCDALEYLRENPTGAHVAYATDEVAAAQASISALSDWLAANGATVPEGLMARAQAKTAEAREKLSPSQAPLIAHRGTAEAREKLSLTHPEHDRERRFRILQLTLQ